MRRAGTGKEEAREQPERKNQSKMVSPRIPRSPKRPRALIEDANAAPLKRPGRNVALKSRWWWRSSKPGAPAELGEHELLDAVAILMSLQNSLPCHDVGEVDDDDAAAEVCGVILGESAWCAGSALLFIIAGWWVGRVPCVRVKMNERALRWSKAAACECYNWCYSSVDPMH